MIKISQKTRILQNLTNFKAHFFKNGRMEKSKRSARKKNQNRFVFSFMS